LKEALRHDRARIQVGRISHFGLMEMSRQRLRTGVVEGSTSQCPHCLGTGIIRSTESVALTVLRALEEKLQQGSRHNVTASMSIEAALYILNEKRDALRDMESRYGISITVAANDKLHGANFTIERGALSTRPVAERKPRGAVQMDWAFAEGEEAVGEPALERDEDADAVGDAPIAAELADEAISAREGAEGDGRRGGRRRRRRRGGRGGERGEAGGEPRLNGNGRDHGRDDVEARVPGAEEDDEPELSAGDTEADAGSGDADGPEGAGGAETGEGGDRRRSRRRGRRGGRRNRRGERGAPGEGVSRLDTDASDLVAVAYEDSGRDEAGRQPQPADDDEQPFGQEARNGGSEAHPMLPGPEAEIPSGPGYAGSSDSFAEAPIADERAPRDAGTPVYMTPPPPPEPELQPLAAAATEPVPPPVVEPPLSGPPRRGWWQKRM
jgi:ribonuclease E